MGQPPQHFFWISLSRIEATTSPTSKLLIRTMQYGIQKEVTQASHGTIEMWRLTSDLL